MANVNALWSGFGKGGKPDTWVLADTEKEQSELRQKLAGMKQLELAELVHDRKTFAGQRKHPLAARVFFEDHVFRHKPVTNDGGIRLDGHMATGNKAAFTARAPGRTAGWSWWPQDP